MNFLVKVLVGVCSILVSCVQVYSMHCMYDAWEVNELVACGNINLNYKDCNGCTLLHYAKDVDTVTSLLDHSSCLDVNIQNILGKTALWCAAEQGRFDIVERLINEPRVSLAVRNNRGQTVVDAIRERYRLLEDISDNYMLTVLEDAERQRQDDAVRTSLDAFDFPEDLICLTLSFLSSNSATHCGKRKRDAIEGFLYVKDDRNLECKRRKVK